MSRKLSLTSQLILAESSDLTNRQVTDKLNSDPQRLVDRLKFDLDMVKNVRRSHNVVYNKPKRDRGIAAKIRAGYGLKTWQELESELDCSKQYIQRIWREMKTLG
jgi:hypothetical protein